MSSHINQSSGTSEIKTLILKIYEYKYLYVFCGIIFLTIAYAVNKYSAQVYETNSVIGPVNNERSGLLGSNELFSGLERYTQARNLHDDLNSIKSFSQVATTIKELSLEIGYFAESKNFISPERQLYKSSPFIVSIDKSHLQAINTDFHIRIIDNNSYRLTANGEEVSLYNYVDNKVNEIIGSLNIDTICKFNETVSNDHFKFVISLNPDVGINAGSNVNYFRLYHLDHITKQYISRLSADPVSMRSSLINVRLRGDNPALTVDFLNLYIQTFLDYNLSKKNQIALNTISFIDSQLSEISDSLMVSESILSDYRARHQVTDLSYQGQQALTQMAQIESELSDLQMRERYYKYLIDYFEKNEDLAGIAPPAASNISDPILNSLILDLLEMNNERSTILSNRAEKNLFLSQIEYQIRLQKQTIIENVRNNLNTLELSKNELDYRSEKLSAEISKLPKTELNLISMQRTFDLTDAIYTYLLQKRSEAAITMASNYPDYELLEPARVVNISLLSPRKKVNWLIALFFSALLPTMYIYIRKLLNDKVSSVDEIEAFTNRKVLNTVYKNTFETESVFTEHPKSSIAESIRNLRSTIFFRLNSGSPRKILITSCKPKDGKSFIALNLAHAVGIAGHKSIIIDCDIRRPVLHGHFDNENSKGLSSYMTGNDTIEDIIFASKTENLSFIPSGPFIMNSAELIEAGRLDDLFKWLEERYEYIICDSTPVGLISDSILLTKYASMNLLIVRNGFTQKDDLRDVLRLLDSNNIDHIELVVNDLDIKESRYGRYREYFNEKT